MEHGVEGDGSLRGDFRRGETSASFNLEGDVHGIEAGRLSGEHRFTGGHSLGGDVELDEDGVRRGTLRGQSIRGMAFDFLRTFRLIEKEIIAPSTAYRQLAGKATAAVLRYRMEVPKIRESMRKFVGIEPMASPLSLVTLFLLKEVVVSGLNMRKVTLALTVLWVESAAVAMMSMSILVMRLITAECLVGPGIEAERVSLYAPMVVETLEKPT